MPIALPKHYQEAWTSIRSALLRSCLAMLGILVGTAAVVTLLSTGRLATEATLAQFKQLGTNILGVAVYFKDTSEHRRMPLIPWETMPAQFPIIKALAPYITTYQNISVEGHQFNSSIIGADDRLAKLIHISMSHGRFISSLDTLEPICVIGNGLAQTISQKTGMNAWDKPIKIGNRLYTVVGVMSPWLDNQFFSEDINQTIITPLKTIPLISPQLSNQYALFILKNTDNLQTTIAKLRAGITSHFPNTNVLIRSPEQLLEGLTHQGEILTTWLAIIGSIALLVGGIGIMNVMLVSLSERQSEIGIRKAVGATQKNIRQLFLTESLVLTALGGLLGMLFGVLLTWVIALYQHWQYHLYPTPLLLGFGVSCLTGLFFGAYPAHRAAKLAPTVCLKNR